MKNLWKEENDELQKQRVEEAKKEATPTVLVDEDGEEYKWTMDQDKGAIDSFQYFDRPRAGAQQASGMISRSRLEGLFLCIDDEHSLGTVADRLTGAGASKGEQVYYRQVCGMRKKVIIPKKEPTPKKPEEPAAAEEGAEEAKEEAAEGGAEKPADSAEAPADEC